MTKTVPVSSARLTCLCGAISEPGDLLKPETFPIDVALCNCKHCRYTGGGLGVNSFMLKSAPSSASLTACRVYESSPGSPRYFCSTCGTKLFARDESGDLWFGFGGAIERNDEHKDVDTINITWAMYVSHTKDGGLVRRMHQTLLASQNDTADMAGLIKDIPCFAMGRDDSEEVPLSKADTLWPNPAKATSVQPGVNDRVEFMCHCESVQFYITRPDKDREYPPRTARFLHANNTKYLGRICVCRDCRLATGTSMQPWSYVPAEHIYNMSDERVNFDEHGSLDNLKGLQIHHSSEGCRRTFCKTCGATVFWEGFDRKDVIDISIGLMRSDIGALAEDWLEWNWLRTSWRDSCRDNDFLRMLRGDNK